jgi:CRP-like cAMP-binding protein
MSRTNKELLDYVKKMYDSGTEKTILTQEFLPLQKLLLQDKRVGSVYILQTGIAKCYLTEDNGKDFIEEFFGEGEIVGEIEIINNHPCVCNIEAITKVEVYKISADDFLQLLEYDKTFNHLILRALSAKIHYKAIRHSYHQSHLIEENLQRLQKDFPDFLNTIPKQDIANYLGITIRSLNRTLNDLKEQHLLK